MAQAAGRAGSVGGRGGGGFGGASTLACRAMLNETGVFPAENCMFRDVLCLVCRRGCCFGWILIIVIVVVSWLLFVLLLLYLLMFFLWLVVCRIVWHSSS